VDTLQAGIGVLSCGVLTITREKGDPMSSRSAFHVGASALLWLALLSPQAVQAQAKGDLWETTSQSTMNMGGMAMPMPPQTQRICAARKWTRPPVASGKDQNCTNSDFAVSGQTVTWTSVCTGQMNMTGKGEITRQGADAYSGTVKYAFAEGTMTVAISGKKVGECDNPQ
jgi:hypothetical protein